MAGSFPFGLGFPAGRPSGGRFEATYRAYPVAFMSRPELESGGKAHLNIQFPMLFELAPKTSTAGAKNLHCGVLEFVAEEGHCYLPYWMMENLLLQEGDRILVKSTSLPAGNFVKLQPHSKTFLDISNPKAVLELELRKFSALTVGEDICITYNNKKYYLHVLEAKPVHVTKAVSIVETDVQVDFAPPMDYVEPQRNIEPIAPPPSAATASAAAAKEKEKNSAMSAEEKKKKEEEEKAFHAFTGSGFRLDGKPAPKPAASSSLAIPTASGTGSASSSPATHSPMLSTSPVAPKPAAAPVAAVAKPAAPKGTLVFGGAPSPAPTSTPAPTAKPIAKAPAAAEPKEKAFVPFSGQGHRLQ